jgi:hypothetical protein
MPGPRGRDCIGVPESTSGVDGETVAAIVRNREGKLRVTTNHHAVGAGATRGCSGACCSVCCSSSRSQDALHGEGATA